MKIETLKQLDLSPQKKLINFIYNCMRDKILNRLIPLSHIDVNDWETNRMPGVYIHNKNNMFKMKRYCRCSDFDIQLAIDFYNKNYK